MRRASTTIALVILGSVVAGMLVPLISRDNRLAANGQASRHQDSNVVEVNRFDRGRLSEEFDAELPRQVSQAVTKRAAEVEFTAPKAVFPANSRSTSPVLPPTAPIPRRPPLFQDDEAVTDEATTIAPPSTASVAARVTLVIKPDNQIRVVAENKAIPLTPADGELMVTADEFTLTPGKEAASANQLVCRGKVDIRHTNFAAHGSALSIDKSDLMLEGTAQDPATISKLAPNSNNAFVTTEQTEFRLAARKITFTLPLDKLQVDSATISPVTPAGPPAQPVPVPNVPTDGEEANFENKNAPLVPPSPNPPKKEEDPFGSPTAKPPAAPTPG